jgi:hypothetical protein
MVLEVITNAPAATTARTNQALIPATRAPQEHTGTVPREIYEFVYSMCCSEFLCGSTLRSGHKVREAVMRDDADSF